MLAFIFEIKEGLFEKSLQNYLRDFQKTRYGNLPKVWGSFTTTANLEKEVLPGDTKFRNIIEAWLGQKGHPIITVTRSAPNVFHVTQVIIIFNLYVPLVSGVFN